MYLFIEQIVAIKGAKVSDYNGVSLSTLGSSVIQVNIGVINILQGRIKKFFYS